MKSSAVSKLLLGAALAMASYSSMADVKIGFIGPFSGPT